MNTIAKRTAIQLNPTRHHQFVDLILSTSTKSNPPASLTNLIQLSLEAKAKRPGHSVHTQIITNGFASHLHLNTKLIIFYTKLSDAIGSRKVFDGMPERSVVSWTAQISGYAQNGYYEDALLLFSEMRGAGFRGNQFTYGSVLRACTGLRCLKRGMQVQGCVEKSRFVGNLVVRSALVDLHSKCGRMEDACYLFQVMEEKDVVSWNAMIGGYAVQGFADDGFRLFCLMRREGTIPDCFTFGSVLKACSSADGVSKVNQLHALAMKLGAASNSSLSGSLINAYMNCESLASAYRIYHGMLKKDIVSCTVLISGYAREGNHSIKAVKLFKDIQKMCIEIDDVILCSMLNICAKAALLHMGRQIHAIAVKHKLDFDVATGNALVDMYAKSGQLEDATHAFNQIKEKNVISWTSLITAYGNHGYGHEAIAVYKKMKSEGLEPNDVTFLSLLSTCSHCGLINEGWNCFNDMISNYKIRPRGDHFSCVIDIFARRGLLEEAYALIQMLNIKPNASLWGAILGACSIHGNMSLGEVAASHLFSMDSENSANYISLSRMYAATGAWGSFLSTRDMIKQRSLRKSPAWSLV